MTNPLLRGLVQAIPPLRRMRDRQAELSKAVEDLARALEEGRAASTSRLDSLAESMPRATIEQALTMVRAEYTVMPRFGFHQPIDYLETTIPPAFGPPVSVPGEALPLPAAADRYGYPADDATYLSMGRLDADMFKAQIARHATRRDGLAVLDFGCSVGRVLRHFEPERRDLGWTLHGVDVQATCIEWLRLHFPQDYQVFTGTVLPHLPLPDNSLDVIYGISVFTHVKYLWDAWLLELKRVLKPGGLLLQTIHTENAWAFYRRHKDVPGIMQHLPPAILEHEAMPHDWIHRGDIGISQAFWKAEVARRFWGRYLEVIDVLPPQHQDSFQDLMVCRKPAG
ncbi:MAG: class I SAM-dependent methyltransferase [Roseomonas sp.]|nr:class I SAM-dependent methyltransferase [Roseomonas sp.]